MMILDVAKRKYYWGKIRIFGKNIYPCWVQENALRLRLSFA